MIIDVIKKYSKNKMPFKLEILYHISKFHLPVLRTYLKPRLWSTVNFFGKVDALTYSKTFLNARITMPLPLKLHV